MPAEKRKEDLEDEDPEEEEEAPWEQEEIDAGDERKVKKAAGEEPVEGGEGLEDEEPSKPGHMRLSDLRKAIAENRRVGTVAASEVTSQYLRAPFSDPVVVTDDLELLGKKRFDLSTIDDSLSNSDVQVYTLCCENGEAGEEQSVSAYKEYLEGLTSETPLTQMYAGECFLRGTSFEPNVSRPSAVESVDASTHVWPSQIAGENPYKNQQLEMVFMPQYGFLDPQPEPHGAAKWHYVIFGAKDFVLLPPDSDLSSAVVASVKQGHTLFVPPGWQTGEVCSEHASTVCGCFYLSGCMATKHHDVWKLEKEGLGVTADEAQVDGFRSMLWYTAAYMTLCIAGEDGAANEVTGAPSLTSQLAQPEQPLPKEGNEIGKLTSLLMRFNKSKNKVIPAGIDDPAALLEDLRARVDFHRGRSKRKRQKTDEAAEEPTSGMGVDEHDVKEDEHEGDE
jgi:hypothetical protein